MDRIEEIYKQYLDNFKEITELERNMFIIRTQDEWRAFNKKLYEKQFQVYASNKAIYGELDKMLADPLDKEKADKLYELSLEIYMGEGDDYLLLVRVFEKLIAFYEQDLWENKAKLLWLYACIYYEINEVKSRQFSLLRRDFSYLLKLLELRKYYAEFEDPKDRQRFFVAYHNMIVTGIEACSFSVEKGYDIAKEMLDFYNSDVVQKLDGDNPEIEMLVRRTRIKMIISIFRLPEESDEIKQRFNTAVIKLYQEEIQKVKSEYELEPILFAGYLYANYQMNKRSIAEIFDDYMDYYGYRCLLVKDEDSPSREAIGLYLDSVEILSRWADQLNEPEKIRKMVANFRMIAERKWRYVSSENISYLNMLMKKLCFHIVKYGAFSNIDSEECVKQMILNRNYYMHLHCKTVEKIAVIIARNIVEDHPELLSCFSNMDQRDFIHTVSTNALFHDIGKQNMYEILYVNRRPMTEEEEEYVKTHPQVGAEFISQFDNLKKYRDVILLHHVDYDGKSGYPLGEQLMFPENKLLVDIIHLADCIEHEFERFFIEETINKESFLERFLVDGRGTKFHPKLVDLIIEKPEILDEMKLILNGVQYEEFCNYVKSLENISISLSFDDVFNEFAHSYREGVRRQKIKELKPYLNRLFVIAAHDNTNRSLGMAYYAAMRYHDAGKEYMECINCALEAVRYLDSTEEYRCMAIAYNTLGFMMQYQGNLENGIGYFLKSVDYTNRISDGAGIAGSAFNNIANLFREARNYERALFYYHLAEEKLHAQEKKCVSIHCSMLYCYFKLNDRGNLINTVDKVKKLCKKTNYEEFDLHVNLAIAYEYLERFDEMEEQLSMIQSNLAYLENYLMYLPEISTYLDLLENLGRFDELIEQLDIYIKYCEENTVNNQFFNNFVQRRIKVGHLTQDYDSVSYYGKYLYLNEAKNKQSRAKISLQMEKAYKESIQVQRKHREVLKQKRKLEKEVMEAQQANAAKSTFLTSMSHEIRTPIHAILGLDEMILRECHEDNILQYAYDIQNAGKTLMGIISDVLDISKMESGTMDITPDKYQVIELIQELKNMIESRAKDKGLQFFIHLEKEVPKALYGDALRIKQTVLNVLTNAVKYTKEGQVDFSIDYEKTDAENINLIFTVKDTGIGMKKEHLEKLSNPFVRFDEDKNRNIEGTGLGMSIVTILIKQMNGELKVDSTYGEGSTFTIKIPQTVIDWNGVGDFFSQKKMTGNVKKEALFTAPDAEVLVVDDNAVNLKVVSSLLKRTRVKVTLAKSGKECLELAEKNQYHLIFLDHRMPELDGVETLQILKQMHGINQDTPVVALTANAISDAATFYKEKGFDELITKPVDHVELERKMKNLLPPNLVQ